MDSPNYIDTDLEAAQNEEQTNQQETPWTNNDSLQPNSDMNYPTADKIETESAEESDARKRRRDKRKEREAAAGDTVEEEEETLEEDVPTDPAVDTSWFTKPEAVPIPEYDPNAIAPAKIEDAPAYEQSAEQQAWQTMHSGALSDIIAKQGIGIDAATQQLMKQQTMDLLRADETEKIRQLKSVMETRGITNASLYISEEMKIKSTTTKNLAASITEIKVKSALMKMASFENAMGLSNAFLGYFSRESELAAAPGMVTWAMKAESKMRAIAASVEVYKIKLQQAYTVNNMYEQAELEAQFATQQHKWDMEMAEIEQETALALGKSQAQGSVSGSIVGAIPLLIK